MKLKNPVKLAEAAKLLGCGFSGPADHLITGMNEIHRVEPGDLTFVDIEKYFKKALTSAATTILINKAVEPPAGKGLLISDNPFTDFNRFGEIFHPIPPVSQSKEYDFGDEVSIGKHVAFGDNVKIGKGAVIGHNCSIGSDVEIGEGTILYPNVSICSDVVIGKNCCINAGSVIGGEAFYFKGRPWGKEKMRTVGRVIIEDNVDIGANCTIDRGVTADTVIGEYTKIDNLVQVGHDTIIGKRCIIAAQVGIAGVVTVEDDCILWGQVGVNKDLTLGKGTILLGKTGVMSSLAGGKSYGGLVADDAIAFLKKEAIMKRLVDVMPQIEKLLRGENEKNK